jgi:DNA-binding beta-propeller fold protein YncE
MPPGWAWGATTTVAIDRDGKSVWEFERCGTESCLDSKLPPILHFDPAGTLLAAFGAGMFVFPHGIAVDPDGNVWVADADGKNGKGQQVVKFSPTGKVLMKLGKAGVPGDAPGYFNRPTGVAIARNGDVFVSDGHGDDSNARVVKFSKTGKFLLAWGKKGSAPGEFDVPHAIAMDSHERVYVADRSNNRIQVSDANGRFLADGSVKYFIPRPDGDKVGPEGVAADTNGTIYGASNEGKRVDRFALKQTIKPSPAPPGCSSPAPTAHRHSHAPAPPPRPPPAAGRTFRATAAPPRSAGTARTSPDDSTTGRRRWY